MAEHKTVSDQWQDALILNKCILDNAALAIISTTTEGVITSFNHAAERMLGYRAEELVGTATPACFHDPQEVADRAIQFSRELGRSIAPGFDVFVVHSRDNLPNEYEWTYIHKDGDRFPVLLSVSALRNATGEITGFLGIANDIRQRKQAEESLHQRTEMLRGLYELSPVGIVLTRMDGGFIEFNQAFARITGYSHEELLRKDYWDLTPKEYESLEARQLELLQKTGRYGPYEKEYVRKDGSRIPLRLNGVVIPGPNQEKYIWSLVEDITEQKRNEQELVRHREMAEAASRAKSQFLANMSHEIRTPMNAVLGLTKLVLDTELQPKQRDYLQKVYGASTTLLGLLNDILDYSKIEAGKLELESVDFNLPEVLEASCGLFAMRAQEKGLRLAMHMSADLPRVVKGDPLRLSQVLHNLVGNAVKFTEKGEITVTARWQECPAPTLWVSVRDTGIGISSDQCTRLFQAFTQADDSTTRKFGGTGLGLAISQRLLVLMGGELHLRSQEGIGSEFQITLPLIPTLIESTGSRQPQPVVTPSFRNTRVLLAEDNELNQIVAREFLEQLGLSVDIASNGQEAVDLAEQNHYSIILMDLHMPVMDGLEATRRIRSTGRGQNVPIVAMTASAMAEDRAATAEVGMNAHITKPIDPDELTSTLLHWISSEQQMSGLELINTAAPSGTPGINAEALKQRLPEVDVDTALRRVRGKTHRYLELLNGFRITHRQTAANLQFLINQREHEKIFRLAHDLKSVAGNIGLDFVSRCANDVCTAYKTGNTEILPKLAHDLADQCEYAVVLLKAVETL